MPQLRFGHRSCSSYRLQLLCIIVLSCGCYATCFVCVYGKQRVEHRPYSHTKVGMCLRYSPGYAIPVPTAGALTLPSVVPVHSDFNSSPQMTVCHFRLLALRGRGAFSHPATPDPRPLHFLWISWYVPTIPDVFSRHLSLGTFRRTRNFEFHFSPTVTSE